MRDELAPAETAAAPPYANGEVSSAGLTSFWNGIGGMVLRGERIEPPPGTVRMGWVLPLLNIGFSSGPGPVSKASLSWLMALKPEPGPGRGVLILPRMPPWPGPSRMLDFCLRLMRKAIRATRAIRTARPPMVPPTIAPVRFGSLAGLATGALVGFALVVSLVAVADSALDVDDVDVVEVAEDDVLDDEEEEDVELELLVESVLVTVPSVVGSLKLLILCVKDAVMVG